MSDPIAIFSLIMSVFMAVATIYKYLYHVGIRADRVEMRDVPLDKSVTLKLMCTKLEYTILNAKLEPHSRVILVPTAEQLKFSDHKFASGGKDANENDAINPLMANQDVPNVIGGSQKSQNSTNGRLIAPLLDPVSSVVDETGKHADRVYAEPVLMPPPVLYSSHSASAHSAGVGFIDKENPTAPPPLTLLPPHLPSINVPFVTPFVTTPTAAQGSTPQAAVLPSPSATYSVAASSPGSALAALGTHSAPAFSEYPPELICPLTRRVMSEPVICADGYTYERSAILQHFQSQKELLAQIGHPTASVTSPITKESLDSEQLFPNRALSTLLAKYNNGV